MAFGVLAAVALVPTAWVADALPPPLPFTYGGSGVIDGRPVLFLEQANGSVMASLGDVVHGAYRVEAIESSRALLRYLPSDVIQVIFFDQRAAAPGVMAPVAAPVKAPPARAPLIVDVPGELPFGQELPLTLGITPGSVAAKATIEITYDANEVAISGARIMRPGRAVVEVSSQGPTPAKPVHLRAVTEQAVQTEIGIAVTAFDAQGRSVEIRGMPAQHIIQVGSAN